MILNGSLIEYAREVVSDALFATDYTALANEWDLFICNLLVTLAIALTVYFFFKIVFGVISIFGG